ncbi:hypothetical protein M1112_00135 [Candidatus Parvarchaeota archaeon]|jgi:hypothetical protein|nr:hypothetical protein [Candidatus Parvarchaeota archaeon]
MLENIITFATNNTSNVTKVLTAPAPGVSLLFAGAESFLFPFLLVFAIVYGVLQRSEIFKGKSDIDAIIAFVLGIIFATTNYALKLTYLILPIVGIIAIIIFMLLVIGSMLYGSSSELLKAKSARQIIVVIAVLLSIGLIIWVLMTANLAFVGISSKSASSDIYSYAPYIIVFAALIIGAYLLFK